MLKEAQLPPEGQHVAWLEQLSSRYDLRLAKPTDKHKGERHEEVLEVFHWLLAKDKGRKPEDLSRTWTEYGDIFDRIAGKKSTAIAALSQDPVSGNINAALLAHSIQPELWYIPWVYVDSSQRNKDFGRATMYFSMLQGYLRGANSFMWDTNTVTEGYNSSIGFHDKVAGSGPDLIKPGYYSNYPDCSGAIWIKGIQQVEPNIQEFLKVT